jgi:hypothetical protein
MQRLLSIVLFEIHLKDNEDYFNSRFRLCFMEVQVFCFLIRCRVKPHYLGILQTYIIGSSVLKIRINELYLSIHHEPVRFPPIQTTRQRRSLPTI